MADSNRSTAGLSIGEYLIRRLQDYGLQDIFGIPGDYILSFYSMLEQSPINMVGCTREDNAGFAADAYARVHGLGAVCVTYCVGGLSICNSIAGAYAEKSPVVVLTGSPGLRERINNPLLHHMVREYSTQKDVFEKLCVATAELADPVTAFREIDRVLDAAARFKRPVYLELPRDMVNVVPHISHTFQEPTTTSDPHALVEAAAEAARLMASAERPMIIAGVELHRFELQDELVQLAEATGIPVAATILGKSVIRETHPLYVGLYEGAMGREEVTEFVEESDLILLLGTFMTDINLGIFTANLDPSKCIYATSEQLRVRHHHYHGVTLPDFMQALAAQKPHPPKRLIPPGLAMQQAPVGVTTDEPLTIRRMVPMINELLDDDVIVIADIGDSLFSATELVTRGRSEFLSPAYYTSMGFAVPATLGVQTAKPKARVISIIGDGAFQMTGMELSTIVRHGYDPVIIVLDNHGYGTERWLHAGKWEYNEIHPWKYSKLPDILGGGTGYEVRTEKEFYNALQSAWNDRDGMSVIHAHLSDQDASETLNRLASRMGRNI